MTRYSLQILYAGTFGNEWRDNSMPLRTLKEAKDCLAFAQKGNNFKFRILKRKHTTTETVVG